MRKSFVVILLFFVTFLSLEEFVNGIMQEDTEAEYLESSSLRRMGGLLEQHNRAKVRMTCDRFPRTCRAKGSAGPDCCKKRCVNVMTDGLNCGECGKKCRYGQKCCGGRCVDVMHDHSNCGGCRARCGKGSFCQYGMCSYAN
ncbi:hypothetical protein HPP92_008653 [Vanilla planifolia]|uniref:Stigma-specific Stig1 family protein n=1 Tax=Vanilla planifolia TaxID=51239 RepID=A0A835REH7_VANPL|nr:hypothetical protein HPP92_008836 [Vanilla planifolia]KAG0486558.1 hypothetical protein HPP92_008653 [Vanilla planifolia]